MLWDLFSVFCGFKTTICVQLLLHPFWLLFTNKKIYQKHTKKINASATSKICHDFL